MDLKYLISLLLVTIWFSMNRLNAQKFIYGLDFHSIVDNREFFSPYNTAESILGVRVAGNAGVQIDSLHSIRIGLSPFFEFGSDFGDLDLDPILYYQYKNKAWKFRLGAFPRNRKDYLIHPFISEKYLYYNPTIEGMELNYSPGRQKYRAFIDWTNIQGQKQREQFFVGFDFRQNVQKLIFQQQVYYFHRAKSSIPLQDEFIEDYGGLLLLIGYNLSDYVFLDNFKLKAGILSSAFRNRKNGSDFTGRSALYGEANIEYKNFGLDYFMKLGSKQVFAVGDQFYNATTNYFRFRVYYELVDRKNLKAFISWSFHLANADLDNQQQLLLRYTLWE